MRRIAAWFAIAVGVTLIGFTFGEHLVSRSHDAQKIADYYQPLMSEQGLADLEQRLRRGEGGRRAARHAGRTALADRRCGMNDDGVRRVRRSHDARHPQFDAQAPGVVALVGPVIGQMQAARADYARASDIPTSWLPLSSAPWLFLGIGGCWSRSARSRSLGPQRLTNAALLVVGLGLVVAPLVIEHSRQGRRRGTRDEAGTGRARARDRVRRPSARRSSSTGWSPTFARSSSPRSRRPRRRPTSRRRTRRSRPSPTNGTGRRRPSRTR